MGSLFARRRVGSHRFHSPFAYQGLLRYNPATRNGCSRMHGASHKLALGCSSHLRVFFGRTRPCTSSASLRRGPTSVPFAVIDCKLLKIFRTQAGKKSITLGSFLLRCIGFGFGCVVRELSNSSIASRDIFHRGRRPFGFLVVFKALSCPDAIQDRTVSAFTFNSFAYSGGVRWLCMLPPHSPQSERTGTPSSPV